MVCKGGDCVLRAVIETFAKTNDYNAFFFLVAILCGHMSFYRSEALSISLIHIWEIKAEEAGIIKRDLGGDKGSKITGWTNFHCTAGESDWVRGMCLPWIGARILTPAMREWSCIRSHSHPTAGSGVESRSCCSPPRVNSHSPSRQGLSLKPPSHSCFPTSLPTQGRT